MADYGAIRQGLADALDTIDTFVTVYASTPSRITPPSAIVIPARPVADYHQSMDGTAGALTRFRFEVIAAVQQYAEQYNQEKLDGLISGTGSVQAALEADPTLGGACLTLQVSSASDMGMVQFADSQFVGVRYQVEVFAR